jgi:hypothetical protein
MSRILGIKQPTGSANRDKDYAKNKTEMDKLWGEKDAAGKRLYLGRADTNEVQKSEQRRQIS